MTLTYIDFIALLVIALMLWTGYRHGLWSYLARVTAFLLGLYAAFMGYRPVGDLIATHTSFGAHIARLVAYILLLIGVQTLVDSAFHYLFRRKRDVFVENRATRVLALLPAALEAALLVFLLVVAAPALPLSTPLSQAITDSATGKLAARAIPAVDRAVDRLTAGRLSAALAELTTHPGSEELPRSLPFRPSSTHIDEAAEAQMLALVNEERAKVGAPALILDPALTAAARLHSEDMWERQYFAHETPDGTDPFARMTVAGARFLYAGENIALAPSTQLAHTGLMNSPGHRRNILDPKFRRVGIGVIDGGIYGKMYTQDFAD